MTKEEKAAIIKQYGRNEQDVGSSEVQVAVLSHKIKELTAHLQQHKKDFSTRRGLIAMVNKRKKLLKYINGKSHEKYLELCVASKDTQIFILSRRPVRYTTNVSLVSLTFRCKLTSRPN